MNSDGVIEDSAVTRLMRTSKYTPALAAMFTSNIVIYVSMYVYMAVSYGPLAYIVLLYEIRL